MPAVLAAGPEGALGPPDRLSSSCRQRLTPSAARDHGCDGPPRLSQLAERTSSEARARKVDDRARSRQSETAVSRGAGSCEGGLTQGRPSKVVRLEVVVILGSSGTFNNLITNLIKAAGN